MWHVPPKFWYVDIGGSMHHNTMQEEKSNKMQQCIKILLFQFIQNSTCFGRHTAHHQEPKNALALPDNIYQLHFQQPSMYAKPEAASAVLGS
jgi:hypothetical protein